MQTQFNPGGNGFAFGAAGRDVTFGRLVTSDGKEDLPAQVASSLGTNNLGPIVGPLVISEIMYHPEQIGGADNTMEHLDALDGSSWLKLLDIPAQATNHTRNVRDSSPPGRTRFYRVRTPMAQ